MLERLRNTDGPDEEEHEHEWLSIGTYRRNASMEPTVVLVCECGAWTTHDLNPESRVPYDGASWAFRPPEKMTADS